MLILIYSDTGFNIPSWTVGDMSWVGGWFTDSSYPERGNVSFISLQNVAHRLRKRQKDGSLFFDGVTRLAGPTSLLFSYQYYGSPSRDNSGKARRRENQNMCERCFIHLKSQPMILKISKRNSETIWLSNQKLRISTGDVISGISLLYNKQGRPGFLGIRYTGAF